MAHPDESLSKVEKLLAHLRESYLQEVPEKCDELEQLVLQLDKADKFGVAFEEIFRMVHSMKGSAGTHGFTVLSTICHQFEDVLHLLDHNANKVSQPIIDTCLRYVDLVRGTSAALQTGHADPQAVNAALKAVRAKLFPARYHGLYVDASKLGMRLCQEALDELPLKLTVMSDGYEALQRLLQEKFDFLITSKELPHLNGIALASAMRASETANAGIRAVLITSKEDVKLPYPGLFDGVVKKDKSMAATLKTAMVKLMGLD